MEMEVVGRVSSSASKLPLDKGKHQTRSDFCLENVKQSVGQVLALASTEHIGLHAAAYNSRPTRVALVLEYPVRVLQVEVCSEYSNMNSGAATRSRRPFFCGGLIVIASTLCQMIWSAAAQCSG